MSKKLCLILFLAVFPLVQLSAATPQEALITAEKKGKVALVLVTEPNVQDLEKARTTIQESAKRIKGSVTIELDRKDAANSALVTKYGLAGAPVPLILVFAPTGVIAGGVPSAQASPEGIVKMVPSPKKSVVLKEITSGKAVLVVAGKKSMKDQVKAMEKCAAACNQIQGKATTVQVDMDDPKEAAFLKDLKVDMASKDPITIVINPQGQLTGTFAGTADTAALIAAATKKAGGCCASGSGKTCGPPKK